jgi:hypothetical protein
MIALHAAHFCFFSSPKSPFEIRESGLDKQSIEQLLHKEFHPAIDGRVEMQANGAASSSAHPPGYHTWSQLQNNSIK